MQEGHGEVGNMENKYGIRPSSAPPKANNADCRKGDGASRFSRNNKRREASSPKPAYDPPSSRRPQAQRSKALDKRPRSRTYNSDRQREEVTPEDRAEYGSALRPGSKKGNFNHLLNFSYAPRGEGADSMGRGGVRGGGAMWRSNKWAGRTHKHYNKEQFIQANCQFVVREEGDYTVHAADPDMMVAWDAIEQVRIFSNEVPSCPICLYPPTAAKMTLCGHIYCWTCILHYLSLGDKPWRQCPICYEYIDKKDLKSVVALETHNFKVGETITMKLMKRDRGSTQVLPYSQWRNTDGTPFNMSAEFDTSYSKLLGARPDQVMQIVSGERASLEQQLREEGGPETLEGGFVQAALDQLKPRYDALLQKVAVHSEVCKLVEALTVEEKPRLNTPDSPNMPGDMNKGDTVGYSSAFDDEVDVKPLKDTPACEGELSLTTASGGDVSMTSENDVSRSVIEEEKVVSAEELVEDLAMPDTPNPTPLSPHKNEHFFFYQASDGQHIYLHSVNARCLVEEYGSWEKCPDTITASIVELEGVSMCTDLRRRLRYLSHLPVSCEFKVAELALKPPIISKRTHHKFTEELEKRKRQRQKKAREEKRHNRRMQRESDRQMGHVPVMRTSQSNPEFCRTYTASSEMATIMATASSSTASSPVSTPYGSPDVIVPAPENLAPSAAGDLADEGHQTSSFSFAQMLRSGKMKADAWPKPVTATAPVGGATVRHDSDESDHEDRVPVPVFRASFGDAIQTALDNYMNKSGPTEVETTVAAVGSRKKKKVPTATLR